MQNTPNNPFVYAPFIPSGIALFQLVFRMPFFRIKAITATVTEREEPYGYLDLDIRNIGIKESKECVLKLTIVGLGKRYEEMELLWRRPTPHAAAEERQTAEIKGLDHFQTIIFDIKSKEGTGDIILRSGAKIPMKVGDKYTFVFSVNGIPASPKTSKFLVNIHAWDCIIVERLHWYSCKRKL